MSARAARATEAAVFHHRPSKSRAVLNVVKNDTGAPPASPGTLSATAACDPYAMRCAFPAMWRDHLIATCGSVENIRRAFGVDEKTARNWLSGKTNPQGWAVEYARNLEAARGGKSC